MVIRIPIISTTVVALALVTGYELHTPLPTDFSAASEQSQLDYINTIRAAHKVPPLAYDAGLDRAATGKVKDMIARHYWTHPTPDGQPFYVLPEKIAPGHKYYAENIAECFTTNKSLFDAYAASPGHLKNIINPRYSLFGGATLWDDPKLTAGIGENK